MNIKKTIRSFTLVVLPVVVLCIAYRGQVWAKATAKALGGAERVLTHISTDKPIYRVGERVYVRGVILDAFHHKPLKPGNEVKALVQIKGPKGDVVVSGYSVSQQSVIGFKWKIPAGQPGGEYTIRISYPWAGYAPAERKFDIRAYRAPRLKSQIVFLRDGYGPGDEVSATLHVERAEGGFPRGAKVTAIARVDGEQVYQGNASVDARGNCSIRFKLPARIKRGQGSLAMVIEDGGVVETAAKTIPILLQSVDLRVYPEGGDLVAGLPARVYFEAKTPALKPADIAGVVVEGRTNATVARFRSEHEGRGRFSFTPKKRAKYFLKITEPSGIGKLYPLPEVKDSGVVLRAVDEITGPEEPVRLVVLSSARQSLSLTLAKREREVASVQWKAEPRVETKVYLSPRDSIGGVLIATVWDSKDRPLAERLVFRKPAKMLNIKITPGKENYVPGSQAKLTVRTTDAKGEPVSAVVGITVTDDSVLEMIEKREQAPRLPVMVLLENDVLELADAHVYLDENAPKAKLALDLLLGTQGWRRFAFADPERFIKEHGDHARRVLAFRAPVLREERQRGWLLEKVRNVMNVMPKVARPVQADLPRAPEQPVAVAEQAAAKAPLDREVLEKRDFGRGVRKALLQAAEKKKELVVRNDFVAFRVYAHRVRPDRRPGDRKDFTETLYWHAGIQTDAKGQATITFGLNDSVTTFRVFADGFTRDGALGQGTAAIESVEPFYIEPKLPLEVTAGDIIQLPVTVVNGMADDIPNTTVKVSGDKSLELGELRPFLLGGGKRVRQVLPIRVRGVVRKSQLVFEARGGSYSDKVTRVLRAVPPGFPVEIAFGGTLEADAAVEKVITIPKRVIRGSITTSIAVYPTPLANMTDALQRLIREPYGCFEQTSSTTYPLIMAQQYFATHAGVDVALVRRSQTLLERGYKRLVSFECRQRGYEWFGGDPGHEALTAYGLLEFTDMRKVREVDAAMVRRTREWLLKRRDGKGGFKRNTRALDSFGRAPQATTNAYCVWALLEAGETGLDKEISAVKKEAVRTTDSYVIALGANILLKANDRNSAKRLMDRLVKAQDKTGAVKGALTSITRSGGQSLLIETTSLALLAWLQDPAYAAAVEKGIRFLFDSCKAGRFGSTQSTVLALRAIVAYDTARAKPTRPGTIQLFIDGKNVGAPVPFDRNTHGAIKLPDIGEVLEPGRHKVELRMSNGSNMPFSIAIDMNTTTPASSEECSVRITTRLSDTEVVEGALTEANVEVRNLSKEHSPMAVAIVGVPGGLEPRHDQLKELVKARRIDAYEVIGREVVLYWRTLKPEANVQVPISLLAAVPGTYTGPASRAYLYYTDEYKWWVDGVKVRIHPRSGK